MLSVFSSFDRALIWKLSNSYFILHYVFQISLLNLKYSEFVQANYCGKYIRILLLYNKGEIEVQLPFTCEGLKDRHMCACEES